jgi:hypothetical protein
VSEPCERFEKEALEKLEAGEPLDEHFSTCPECVKRHAQYRQMLEGLRTLHRGEPRAGWEQRTMEAIVSGRRQARPARRSVLVAGTAGLLAAAALVFLVVRQQPVAGPPTLAAVVHHRGAGQLRGEGVQPGDVIELTADRAGAARAEIRVYRNDNEVVFRCADGSRPSGTDQTCQERDRRLVGSLVIPSIGVFQPILVTSARQIPEPTGSLKDDSARLIESGAAVTLALSVRAY